MFFAIRSGHVDREPLSIIVAVSAAIDNDPNLSPMSFIIYALCPVDSDSPCLTLVDITELHINDHHS